MSTLHPSRHLGSAACSGHTDSDCRSSTSGGSREWHRRHGITSDSNDSRCSRMDTKSVQSRLSSSLASASLMNWVRDARVKLRSLLLTATTVRLKAEQNQLVIARCAFGYIGVARERSLYLHLFECRDGNDLQQCVEGRFQPEPFARDSNQHVD